MEMNNSPQKEVSVCQALLKDLMEIIERLTAPDGCPWDREQTPESIRKYIIEEGYELIDAIDGGNPAEVMEELGDLLFLLLFLAHMYESAGDFQLSRALISIREKMIRRHPHIFGDLHVTGTKEVVANWQAIKADEARKKGKKKGVLGDLPRAMPALQKAYRLGERASRIGFDWEKPEQVMEKVKEELSELQMAMEQGDEKSAGIGPKLVEEMGDLLFSMANLARKLDISPEDALQQANAKFKERFQKMEALIEADGRDIHSMQLPELDSYWEQVKKEEASTGTDRSHLAHPDKSDHQLYTDDK